MKTKLPVAIAIVACIGFLAWGAVALAETEANATAHVYCTVDPNCTMSATDANVNAGSIQMGDFTASITYRVDANTEAVKLWAQASNLYKGDDPANTEVAPIPLNVSAGVPIDPASANPQGGVTNVATYKTATVIDVEGFPGYETRQIIFESSQSGHFSQDVEVTVTWNQDDPEKPQGEYSGKVKLLCLVVT